MGSQTPTLRVWRVTKYNPADRDEQGHYVGSEDTDSDHGPVEAAYLAAVAAFAADSGVDILQIREPSVPVVTGVGPDIHERFDGLVELFGGRPGWLPRRRRCTAGSCRGAGAVDVAWRRRLVPAGSGRRLPRSRRLGPVRLCRQQAAGCPTAVAFAASMVCSRSRSPARRTSLGFLDDDHIDVRPADAVFWADLSELVASAARCCSKRATFTTIRDGTGCTPEHR